MASTGRSAEANSEAVRRLTAEVEQYRALMPRYEQVQERVAELVRRVADSDSALQASKAGGVLRTCSRPTLTRRAESTCLYEHTP